jgi:hypothetical protein
MPTGSDNYEKASLFIGGTRTHFNKTCSIPKCLQMFVVSKTACINGGEQRNPIWRPIWPSNTWKLLFIDFYCLLFKYWSLKLLHLFPYCIPVRYISKYRLSIFFVNKWIYLDRSSKIYKFVTKNILFLNMSRIFFHVYISFTNKLVLLFFDFFLQKTICLHRKMCHWMFSFDCNTREMDISKKVG